MDHGPWTINYLAAMFTGIIECTGKIVSVSAKRDQPEFLDRISHFERVKN
jgi:riboflavin synthase alpha subunit